MHGAVPRVVTDGTRRVALPPQVCGRGDSTVGATGEMSVRGVRLCAVEATDGQLHAGCAHTQHQPTHTNTYTQRRGAEIQA